MVVKMKKIKPFIALIAFVCLVVASIFCGEKVVYIAAAVVEHESRNYPYVIAIDPGHGGTDTGAEAIVKEIEVCNMTAAYLFELLDKDPNFIPIYTRTKDSDPESKERAEVANSAKASLFLSIHANSDSYSSSRGFECYPTPPGREFHEESLRFANIVVENMRKEGHKIRGNDKKTGIKYAYYSGDNKTIVDSDDERVRKRKSFGVLEKSNCPALLAEQCFVTNYEDVENWTGEQGCLKAANVYYSAIKQFFNSENA